MNTNKTFIGVVIDRSGSMSLTASDTIGGFNSFLKEQKSLPGEADLSLALFDHEYTVVHDCIPLEKVPDLDSKTYVPRGNTALLDAIGRTVNTMGEKMSLMSEPDRPGKVILAILTDGYENASKEFTRDSVMEMLKHQQEKYAWDVIYFGANQDAITTGATMGFSAQSSNNYKSTSAGTQSAYSTLSTQIRSLRSNAPSMIVNVSSK